MTRLFLKFSLVLVISCLLIAGSGITLSAQPAKGKSEKQIGKKETSRSGENESLTGNDEKQNENQGSAFGKNKGNLTGKEFGMERSAAAKLKKENNEDNAENKIDLSADSEKELNVAKKKMKKDKIEKRITKGKNMENKEKTEKVEKDLKTDQE